MDPAGAERNRQEDQAVCSQHRPLGGREECQREPCREEGEDAGESQSGGEDRWPQGVQADRVFGDDADADGFDAEVCDLRQIEGDPRRQRDDAVAVGALGPGGRGEREGGAGGRGGELSMGSGVSWLVKRACRGSSRASPPFPDTPSLPCCD